MSWNKFLLRPNLLTLSISSTFYSMTFLELLQFDICMLYYYRNTIKNMKYLRISLPLLFPFFMCSSSII